MVGFVTRYAGGCTRGHAIMGLLTLQWPSLVATFGLGGATTVACPGPRFEQIGTGATGIAVTLLSAIAGM